MNNEKMVYFITTIPLTEKQFHVNYTPISRTFKNDWGREPDDYELYKDDPKFKELNKAVREAKKERDNYKELVRKNNK